MPPISMNPAQSAIVPQPSVVLPSPAAIRIEPPAPAQAGSLSSKDPMRAIVTMSATQAFAAANDRLGTLAHIDLHGAQDAAVKAATAAVAALTETSLLLQQGHRKLDDMTQISPELSANLMTSATQLAAIAPSVLASAGSTKVDVVSNKLTSLVSAVSTTTATALDLAKRAAAAAATPTPGGYL